MTMLACLLLLDLTAVTYEHAEKQPWVQLTGTSGTPQQRAAAVQLKADEESARLERTDFSRNDSLLLHSLNRNGLAAFLMASLVTGAVNISIRTLFVAAVPAYVILCGYLAILSGSMLLLNRANIVLKFW
jgi:hypothetical protein